jgi:hypothetical protein
MPWKPLKAEKPINLLGLKRLKMQYAHCTNYYDVGFAAMWQEKTKEVIKVRREKSINT